MLKNGMRIGALCVAALFLLSGCLVSILVLVDKEIDSVSPVVSFYSYAADITEEQDWQDHQEDIEFVNYVTFDLYLTNTGTSTVTFNGYIDNYDHAECTDAACAETKTRVLRNITIPPGGRHITAGQSFAFIENMEVMKTLAESGQFRFYGVSEGGNFGIESGRVIVAIVVSAP